MADDKPWSVAFAGTGDTSENNIKGLLDDWLPEKLEHLTVPVRIGRRHTGLKRTRDWLADEVGEESLSETEVGDLVSVLARHREEGTDVYLVYIPGEWDEESDEAKIVRGCVERGIPVKDLTAGLDDFEPPEPPSSEPEKTEEPPAARRRGKPRAAAEEPAATREEAEAAGREAVREALAEVPSMAGQALPEALPNAAVTAAGVQVTLSQETVLAIVGAFALMAADVKASVVAELPGASKPQTYPFWVDEDGNYRPRTGRGRGKTGEQKVDLTADEVAQLGLELPE